ncbi:MULTISPECIES: carbohydrate ABC transporter permease [Streptacidiphilus]|uniref:Carbohydrate ABC transporter permease n=2 Tax=Streptacidiphilus TaxID=228398 RepID=A0ABV6ULB8_9ACTN|nr:sugar ABC transporter permease [Streptacidiphilus jeojiense]
MSALTASPPQAASVPAPTRARARRRLHIPLLLAPFALLFVIAFVAPLVYGLVLSLFRERFTGLGWNGSHLAFAGFHDYARALQDSRFLDGLGRVLLYAVIDVPLMLAVSLVLALLLDSALTTARRFFQALLLLPHFVPGLIAALIWVYLYTPGLSPLTSWLGDIGLHVNFFSSGSVLGSIVNISLWQWIGYNSVLLYVALQSVSPSVLEAARLDGAGEIRTALSIKVPHIRPALVVSGLFTIIGSLQLFTEPKILQGSAGSTVTASWTPNLLAFSEAFNSNDYSYAAAVSLLLAAVAGVLSLLAMKLVGRVDRSSQEADS